MLGRATALGADLIVLGCRGLTGRRGLAPEVILDHIRRDVRRAAVARSDTSTYGDAR